LFDLHVSDELQFIIEESKMAENTNVGLHHTWNDSSVFFFVCYSTSSSPFSIYFLKLKKKDYTRVFLSCFLSLCYYLSEFVNY